MNPDERARRAEVVVSQIEPLLAGQGPEVQGAALADLVSTWLAGHHASIRGGELVRWMSLMLELVPINDKWPKGEVKDAWDNLMDWQTDQARKMSGD